MSDPQDLEEGEIIELDPSPDVSPRRRSKSPQSRQNYSPFDTDSWASRTVRTSQIDLEKKSRGYDSPRDVDLRVLHHEAFDSGPRPVTSKGNEEVRGVIKDSDYRPPMPPNFHDRIPTASTTSTFVEHCLPIPSTSYQHFPMPSVTESTQERSVPSHTQDAPMPKITPPAIRYSDTPPLHGMAISDNPIDHLHALSQEEKNALYLILTSLAQDPSENSEAPSKPVPVIPLEPVDEGELQNEEDQKIENQGFWAPLKSSEGTGGSRKVNESPNLNGLSAQTELAGGTSRESPHLSPARNPAIPFGSSDIPDKDKSAPTYIKDLLNEFGKLSSEIKDVEKQEAKLKEEKVMLMTQASREDEKHDGADGSTQGKDTTKVKSGEVEEKEEGEESADEEDEEELLEMQLRLQALESTLKGRSTAPTKQSAIDLEEGELAPGSNIEKKKTPEAKVNSGSCSPTPEELVNKKIAERLPWFHKTTASGFPDVKEKQKPQVSERVAKRAEERRKLARQSVTRRTHRPSAKSSRPTKPREAQKTERDRRRPRRSSRRKSPTHPLRSPVSSAPEKSIEKQKTRLNKWQQMQREKILRTEDPNTQLEEFYKLLSTRKNDLGTRDSSPSTSSGRSSSRQMPGKRKQSRSNSHLDSPMQKDNFDICSMDIEEESQETPDLMPEDMPPPPGTSPPSVYPFPVLQPQPHPMQFLPPLVPYHPYIGPPAHPVGASSMLAPIILPPPPPPPPLPAYEVEPSKKENEEDVVVLDDDDDGVEEDEMEALRKLALASLQKKKRLEDSMANDGAKSDNRSVRVVDRDNSSQGSSVRITVEQDTNERLVVLPKQDQARKAAEKMKQNSKKQNTALRPSSSEPSFLHRKARYSPNRERPLDIKKIQASLRYYQGPVVIELDSDDSDWEGAQTNSKKEEKVSSFLDDFLKRVREKTDKVKAAQKPERQPEMRATPEKAVASSEADSLLTKSTEVSPTKVERSTSAPKPSPKKSPRTRTTSNSAEYVAALKNRLQLCENDMEKNKKTLSEDRARMKILNAALKKHDADLQSSEQKAKKLREELAAVTRVATAHKKTMQKLKRETLLVQARVTQNETIEKTYEDIKTLISRKDPRNVDPPQAEKKSVPEKSDKKLVNPLSMSNPTPALPKTSSMPPSRLESLTATAAKLEEHKKKLTEMSQQCVKKLQKIQRAKIDGSSDKEGGSPRPPGKNKRKAGKENSVDKLFAEFQPKKDQPPLARVVEAKVESPLLQFRGYRISPQFVNLWSKDLFSSTFSHRLDPLIPICPFSIKGTCSDNECQWQHESDYKLDYYRLAADLISYFPSFAKVVETPPHDYQESVKMYMEREFPGEVLSGSEALPLLLKKLRAASMETECNFPLQRLHSTDRPKTAEPNAIPAYNRFDFSAKRKRYFC